MSEALKSEVYRPVVWILQADDSGLDNPFYVTLTAEARGPEGRVMTVPGFYSGAGEWRVRFSPVCEGAWELTAASSLAELAGQTTTVDATANTNDRVHGVVRVDPDDPLHFRHDDGTPYFLFAYECNWLFALMQGEGGAGRGEQFLDMIDGAGFNHLMVNSYAYDCGWQKGKCRPNDYGPPELLYWEGEHGAHDYSRLNLDYFAAYDRMMWALWQRGIDAHIYLKVYNKLVDWPERRSREEDLFFDYFVARYQAFPNIAWDFSKECYNEPDKQYVCDRLDRVREIDAYGHMTTVHDDWLVFHDLDYSASLDFITDQNHKEWYQTILNQREMGVGPVFNEEFGYEHGPGGMDDYTYRVVQPPVEVLSRTYEVIMAGGYACYYYTNHAWDVVEWEERPAGLDYYKYLSNFFTETDWRRLTPRPEMGQGNLKCLAADDELVLFRRGGRGVLAPTRELDGSSWSGYLMDITTGERRDIEIGPLQAGRRLFLGETLGEGTVVVRLTRR